MEIAGAFGKRLEARRCRELRDLVGRPDDPHITRREEQDTRTRRLCPSQQ